MFFIKYIVNYLKRHYRIDQGTEFVEALRHINQPSEVTVPNELIPAGVLMQLRGLYNLHALSINNDWVWPYWIEQQFNPRSVSFIPRAMSLTYINLTHRNWTAVGVLGGRREAVVDPRGMVTPWLQGWSLDTWLYAGGRHLFPSRAPDAAVRQHLHDNLPMVETEIDGPGLRLRLEAWAFRDGEHDFVVHEAVVSNPGPNRADAELAFALRPYNPEGLSLIQDIAYNTRGFWLVGPQLAAYLPAKPDRSIASSHSVGDVSHHLRNHLEETTAHCDSGLANGASIYHLSLEPGAEARRIAVMPVEPLNPRRISFGQFTAERLDAAKETVIAEWKAKLAEGTTVELPDRRYQDAFDANKAFLLLLNDGQEITAGPLTYHRHWFRDAAFLLNALGKAGYGYEVARNLECFPLKQWKNGYFCSQKGEWDSNGEALWAILEHHRLTGDRRLLEELWPSIRRAAIWIDKKRRDISFSPRKPRGLMPAGFSAEHLGPNDYYYWDNFWGLRGILDAAEAARALGHEEDADLLQRAARSYERDLLDAVSRDIEHSEAQVLPAAPRRRPDAGMIGNIAAAYPLKLFHPEDTPWLANTVRFIRDHLFHDDGFYQQMIHSGVNSYLTLQMAQCLMLMGDLGAYKLAEYMLRMATPSWCWPEAIHPRTLGGCMGDGHHGWAAAEWVLLVRNMILHERDDVLQVTRLVPAEWCHPGQRIAMRKAPTAFGTASIEIVFAEGREQLKIDAQWRTPPREIHWHLPAAGRKIVVPREGVVLEGTLARLSPDVREVQLEMDLSQAHSMAEGSVPGIDDL
jgi:hypothetical protein